MPDVRRRRRLAALIVLQLVVAGGALLVWSPGGSGPGDGGDQRAAGPAEETLTGSQALLRGTVTDESGRKPIEGAAISIDHAGGPLRVVTGADGSFRAVVDASRPVGFTVDAPGHRGAVAFGRLCPGERRTVSFALSPASAPGAPPPPVVLEEQVCR